MEPSQRLREPRRTITSPPAGISLEELSGRISCVPWENPEGEVFGPITGAKPTRMLCQAVTHGFLGGPWQGPFPRYVWQRQGELVHEFRLVDREKGEYIGYQLPPSAWPEGLT